MLAASCLAIMAALVVFYAARHSGWLKTILFVERLDLARYIRQGTDFGNPDFTLEGSARRMGVPPGQLDEVYGYDFSRLDAAEARLAGVDRPTTLRAIFEKLTAGARSSTERHLRVLKFLQQASLHNAYLQPTYPDRTMVMDPLVLLELGEMRCGHVARLAVDLFDAGGYRGRLVPLGGHVIAEIEYDGAWHYFDADLFGNGDCVLNADGTIPSVEELSREPLRIDALPVAWEPGAANAVAKVPPCRASYYYFSREAWVKNYVGSPTGPQAPYAMYKRATAAEQRRSRVYGWDCVHEDPAPRRLADIPRSYPPGAPELESVRLRPTPEGQTGLTLAWKPAEDPDGDLLGYRIMVSRYGRGWNYNGKSLPDQLMELKSSPADWDPSMYEARFTTPKSEIVLVETPATTADLTLPAPGDYFVTVMPYDAHGEKAGQKLYPMSEEIRIRVGPSPEKLDGAPRSRP